MAHSEIPPYSIAILRVFLAVLLLQEFFFAQYLPVEQPNAGSEVDQQNPIGFDRTARQNPLPGMRGCVRTQPEAVDARVKRRKHPEQRRLSAGWACWAVTVTRAGRSAIKEGPAGLISQPLVVEHESSDLAPKLGTLPLALPATSFLALTFGSSRACGPDCVGRCAEFV